MDLYAIFAMYIGCMNFDKITEDDRLLLKRCAAEHTLSIDDAVDDLAYICMQKGGGGTGDSFQWFPKENPKDSCWRNRESIFLSHNTFA